MVWRLRFKDRVLEWHVAAYTCLFGVWLSGPGEAFNPITLRILLDLVPEAKWAAAFTIIGTVHLVALAINGAAWWTPITRTVAAIFNLFAYVFLTAGIFLAAPDSSGVATYGFFVVPTLVTVIFRASRDAFLVRKVLADGGY